MPKCLAMNWRYLVAMVADIKRVIPRENTHAMY